MASVAGGGGTGGSGGPPNPPGSSKSGIKKRDYMKGKSKKKYTVDDKKKIIELIEQGWKTCDIVKKLGVPESSVRNIRKKKDEIKATLKTADKYFRGGGGGAQRAIQDTTSKNQVMVITEHYLMKWVTRRLKEKASVDGPQIRTSALKIYDSVCRQKNITNPAPFNASKGWLYRFRKRCGVKYAIYQGEISSGDAEVAKSYPEVAKLIIEEGGYNEHQIFNCDETGVYWKKSPKATYIPTSMKQAPGMKLAKDRFSVLLTCNVSGDFKMKPVIIYKYAKPHSYRNCDMKNLPNCVWYSNASGYMTAVLSVVWFDEVFVPKVRDYCRKKNAAFKIVLFLDNAPGHAKYLVGRHPNVQVVFLPPNTTSTLQPLDQELIANTKLLFYAMLHNKMREATDNQQELRDITAEVSGDEDDPDMPPLESASEDELDNPAASSNTTALDTVSVKLFWRNFKIKQAVDMFCVAWNKITNATVKHAWSALLPHMSLEQEDRQREEDLVRATASSVRQLPGMADIQDQEIQALVSSSHRHQTIEDMLDEDEDNETVEEEPVRRKQLSTKELSDILASLDSMQDAIQTRDVEGRDNPLEHLKEVSKFFRELYNSKIQTAHQSLITRYIRQRNEEQEAVREAIDTIDMDAEPALMSDDDDLDFVGFDQDVEEALRLEREALARDAEAVGVRAEDEEEGEGGGGSGQ